MPNALARESSPYLRQHADNPVAWLPWGEAAFAQARALDRPIFLSIGYSTCHWCHVMAHESFENEAIAAQLNADFVSIKLDREERPDVDRVYMAYVQALTGQGGWPLSAWLTPDLKPFYAGTYYPPEDRGGRPGLPSLLRALARAWRDDRANLLTEADRVVRTLREQAAGALAAPPGELTPLSAAAGTAFEKAMEYYANLFDGAHGGFGGAPKFPRPGNLAFLLRCGALQGLASDVGREAVGMVAGTLKGMAEGGIHDHVGGGFHRYAIDAAWFVPHFEKMLYDQAQIATVALGAWQATGDERQAWLARDALDYALRDLAAPAGGFYAAEDADSDRPDGPGHAEGAFYVWTHAELARVLGDEAALVAAHFGVTAAGNVPSHLDPHREFTGRNVLAQVQPLAETARRFGVGPEAASGRLVAALERLRIARSARPRPHRDEKIITAWNGLMISALARAAVVPAEALADRRAAYREAAVRTARFAERELGVGADGLARIWRPAGAATGSTADGAGGGFAEDYACLIQGLLDLYESTYDVHWLVWADRLQDGMDARFWDADRGGYFNSAAGAADIVVRLKEDYDGAEPAASSLAALNLLRLAGLLHQPERRERGRKTLAAFRTQWEASPQAMPQLLCAVELALEPPRHVVLTGEPGGADFEALAAVLHERLGPSRAVVALDAPDGARAWWTARAPWLAGLGRARPAVAGKGAVAYVCEEFTCRIPATSPSELRAILGGTPPV
jgi:uncharacterized protein YyaL (SSP411 family)